jgi:hypothetical protein
MRGIIVALATFALLGGATLAQSGHAPPGSNTLATATGGIGPAVSLATRFAERIDAKADFGATGNALTLGDGTITAGTNAFSSQSTTFSAADVGKKEIINGAGTSGGILSTTIAAVVDAHDATLAVNAGTTTPWANATYAAPVAGGATASYAPGDTVTLAGGTSSVPTVLTIKVTTLVSATINAAGSGGTTGACLLTGTTGTALASKPFTLTGTVSGGALSGALTVGFGGYYTTNPTVTGVAVTGCGLSAATLNLVMGPADQTISTQGRYSVAPASPTAQASTSGSGAGATWRTTYSNFGGEFTYGTDDTASIAAAISYANTLAGSSSGINLPKVVYLPSGNYLVDGAQLPTFFRNGGIVGDGPKKTFFTIGADYSGDLLSWDDAWATSVYSDYNGSVITGAQLAGPIAHGFTIFGNRATPNQQNGLVFYDRNTYVVLDDIEMFNLRGRGFYFGVTKNQSIAFLQESRISNIRIQSSGLTGAPVIEFNTVNGGTGDTDVTNVDIYDPRAVGIVLRSNSGNIDNIKFVNLRIEGGEYGNWGVADDLLRIGDVAMAGRVSSIEFVNTDLIDPYLGFADVRLTAPSAATAPFQISMQGGAFDGGTAFGAGIAVDAGSILNFAFSNVASDDYTVSVASSTTTASPIIVSGGGQEIFWAWNVDTTALGYVRVPITRGGVPAINSTTAFTSAQIPDGTTAGGNARGGNSTDWSTLRFSNLQVASGSGATIGGGVNNDAAGSDSTVAGGSGNTADGFRATIGGGFGNTALGIYSDIPGGIEASTFVLSGFEAFSAGDFAAIGDSEIGRAVLQASTSSTTPTRLVSGFAVTSATPNSGNTLNIPDNSAWLIDQDCIYLDTVNAAAATWYWHGILMTRGSGAASTVVSAPSATVGATAGSPGASAPVIAADQTLGALSVTFTAPNTDLSHTTCRAHLVIEQ